jgi:hypothetical protein
MSTMHFGDARLSEWADLTECESQLQFRENVFPAY